MTVLQVLATLLIIASVAVIIAKEIVKAKRRKLPGCKSCFYCKPIPKDAGPYFHSMERHCALHRGADETFGPAGVTVSVVTEDDYCSSFNPRDDIGGMNENPRR